MKEKPKKASGPKAKPRRRGYRGYGSPLHKDQSGTVHWGRGFTGVGFPGEDASALPPTSQIVPDDLRPTKKR